MELDDTAARDHDIGWLWLVGSLKLKVSFAKEPYKRDCILQKRPVILRSLLIVATAIRKIYIGFIIHTCNIHNSHSIYETYIEYTKQIFDVYYIHSIYKTFIRFITHICNVQNKSSMCNTYMQYTKESFDIWDIHWIYTTNLRCITLTCNTQNSHSIYHTYIAYTQQIFDVQDIHSIYKTFILYVRQHWICTTSIWCIRYTIIVQNIYSIYNTYILLNHQTVRWFVTAIHNTYTFKVWHLHTP